MPKYEICRKKWDFENDYIITKSKFLPDDEDNINNIEQNNINHEETF